MSKSVKVTYLGHSGFLVETAACYLLFDYYKGELPALLPDKKLFVFSSHRHQDHYNPQVLNLAGREGGCVYILSDHIRKKRYYCREIAGKTQPECVIWVKPHRELEIDGLGKVETLQSTDEGVAFIVNTEQSVIYHAGDLHWWNWDGEDPAWLRNMEVNYKREISRLEGRHFDLAFLVLDDRLEENYAQGMTWFLGCCTARAVFPMHFWEDKSVVERFPKEALGGARLMRTDTESCWEISG